MCCEHRTERREKLHTEAQRCKDVFLYIFPDVGERNPWSDTNFGKYFRVTDARKLENLHIYTVMIQTICAMQCGVLPEVS
jgi:hypothetical protein